jgi:tRNA-specific adenosine deaminase 3
MALALGLGICQSHSDISSGSNVAIGSIFNHSDPPNVTFTLDTTTDSIRYITSRDIEAEEELCIFYGHQLWFDPVGCGLKEYPCQDPPGDPDEWGGLNSIDCNRTARGAPANPFTGSDTEEILSEEDLPFVRYKVPPEEEGPETVRTSEYSLLLYGNYHRSNIVQAWVVDVPDPKLITTLLKYA